MTRPLLRFILLAALFPALLPAQRLWVGMPVTAVAPDSQLGDGLPPDLNREDLYLVEFNDTRFADPATESGRLNLQLLLNQWDQFRAAPPRGLTRLAFLQLEGRLAVLHRVELVGWDGRLETGATPRAFQLAADPEVRHHNAFIYLKTARQALAAGETGQAKAFLARVPIMDATGAEAPQARDLLATIEADERRRALEALLARAEAERSAGRLEEAIALYQEAQDRFGAPEEAQEAMAEIQAELQSRLKAAEDARRAVEEQQRKEKEQARRAQEQARVQAEAVRQAQVQAKVANRERELTVFLTQARIHREQNRLQEAAEALQAARNLDPDDSRVEAESRALGAAVARQKLREAREARKAGRMGEALGLLREAGEWDPRNQAVAAEIQALRDDLSPGEVDRMDLAQFVWNPDENMQFVFTPPASPETETGRMFLWKGVLDQEIEGHYLVKVGRHYQFCFIAGFPLKGIGFNTGVQVVGEYIGNLTFTTVLDVPVQVPCLKAFYAE
jgi:tetratricopeptide (TPR) repeat protein